MKIETRLDQDYRTIIPTNYIQKHNLEEGDIVQWNENEKGEILITFKKNNLFSK
jgi:bifunctional DNA-binding transcriptional regulator/antitoxin component of YhaV-PrlF toxin-antitoxin module